jgi:hypothetical protein
LFGTKGYVVVVVIVVIIIVVVVVAAAAVYVLGIRIMESLNWG